MEIIIVVSVLLVVAYLWIVFLCFKAGQHSARIDELELELYEEVFELKKHCGLYEEECPSDQNKPALSVSAQSHVNATGTILPGPQTAGEEIGEKNQEIG